MSAPAERTVLQPTKEWLDGDSVDREIPFSRDFDPKTTAAEDAREIVWKYAEEIKEAILK